MLIEKLKQHKYKIITPLILIFSISISLFCFVSKAQAAPALTLSDHQLGQVENQWRIDLPTVSNFHYRYRLSGSEEEINIGTTTFGLSGISGVTTGDISNAGLYYDFNGDGQITASSSWTKSFETGGDINRILALTVDSLNATVYAGINYNANHDIYYCQPRSSGNANGICEDGEWIKSFDFGGGVNTSFTVDPINGTIYAGLGYSTGNGDIYACQPQISGDADGLCEVGEWSLSFDGSQEYITSLTVDPLNGTIYAGQGINAGDGDIYACQPLVSGNANGLCEDGEWIIAFETGALIERIESLTFDPVNGTIYAGLGSSADDGDIYSCQPLVSGNTNGLCEDGEWIKAFETGALIETVSSLTVDPINGTIYAGLGTTAGDGDIYSCQPLVSGNANGLCEDGEWIKAFETGAFIEAVYSLTVDPISGTIYAGLGFSAGDGDIYSCRPKVSGNANGLCEDGEWIKAFETGALIEAVYSLAVDSLNGTIYAGLGLSAGDGDIFYHFTGDSQISSNGLVDISGANGTITFATSSTYYNSIGDTNYLLRMTTSNIINTDSVTIDFNNASSTGNITSGQITLSGDSSAVTHQAAAFISSAANQTFAVGQATTSIAAITVTENSGINIKATNDIRITIATSSVNMRWDTTDTTAIITGTASSSVSTTVSYENNGATLVINVTSDFGASENITISGLSFLNFNSFNLAYTGALRLYLDGVSSTVVNAYDDKSIAIAGSLVLADHQLGQVSNQWQAGSSTVSNFHYRYQLIGDGEEINIGTTTFNLSGVSGVTTGDISNARLYYDFNRDGQITYPTSNVSFNLSATNATADSIVIDTINGTVYAGLGFPGVIFSCQPSVSGNANGICESGEWISSFEGATNIDNIYSLTFDPINGTIYAGLGQHAGDGDIFSCQPLVSGNANGLCEDGEWIKAFETGALIRYVYSLTVDPINGTIYAGISSNTAGDADFYACRPLVSGNANGLCEDGEWSLSFETGSLIETNRALTVDPINGTIYAGLGSTAGDGDIYACQPLISGNANGLCEDGEWTKSFESGAAIESIQSLTFDPINGTIYAGLGLSAGDGDIYSCRPLVSGNANGLCEDGEWIKAFEAGATIEAVWSLTFDPISGTIYAGLGFSAGDGDIYSCRPKVSGNANGLCELGEWIKIFDGGSLVTSINALATDSLNGVFYSGISGNGLINYHVIGDSQISSNGLVNISGANGTITFATSSSYTKYIGPNNYLLQMTTSNIINTDSVTIDFNNASSIGSITSGQITLSGDSSATTHYIDASISSAANQTFAVGQETTSIAAITITENVGINIKATNDIRITIATSSVNMRWDTTDTTAIITGTASSSVSTIVSYENNGATLVINVTSDFGASENITISGLSFLNFNSFNPAYTGALRLYLDGVSSTFVNAYDDKSIAIAGSLVLADHQLGQVSNQWQVGSSTVSSFYYRYKLTGVEAAINIGTTTFDLSGISGVTTGDISNASLYYDFNGDGKITASTPWTQSYEGGSSMRAVYSLAVDPINGTVYAGFGSNLGTGDIYACRPLVSGNANGICEHSEWTKVFETGGNIEIAPAITVDTINGTIYVGLGLSAGDGDIFSCQPLVSGNANGLCEDGEWSTSFESGSAIERIQSLTFDPINGTIYAGLGLSAGDGDIFSCQPLVSGNANGLCEDGEWIKAFETGVGIEYTYSLTVDPINGTIYAGLGLSAGDGDIFSCQPLVSGNANGLCENGEWIKAFETGAGIEYTHSLTVDTINGTIYAGLGLSAGDGDIFSCQPLVSGNANGLCEDGEWIKAFETGAAIERIESLTFDPVNGTIYAGLGLTAGDGDIFSCQPLVSGNANGLCEDGEWIKAFETGAGIEYTQSLTVDPLNAVVYAGLGDSLGDGDIFYHFIGDSQISNKGLVDISGTNGTITFATSSSYTKYIGASSYLLQMTTSNIVNTDSITIDFNNASSTKNITLDQITLRGDSSEVTHQIDAAISSAVNQTFSLGQATTSIAAITITDYSGINIKATNDIRITVATSSVNMRWDTTDTTAIITGTASSSVSTTVSYENNGATLLINVTSDFSADAQITISGLSFTGFNRLGSGNLGLYLDGALDTVVNTYDDKSITIAGILTLADHQLGQVANQWVYGSSTISSLHYRYQLTSSEEEINIGTTTFGLSGISGVSTGDVSNANLYYDFNGDGKITASSSWTKAFETGAGIEYTQSLIVDPINGTIYAGLGLSAGDGDIYSCQPLVSGNANGLCEDGEWSLSFDGTKNSIRSLTVDTINGTIYAGQGGTTNDGDIYACQPKVSGNANGLCEDGEWIKAFETGVSRESIQSLTFDPINGTIYAGLGDNVDGDGDIYACQPLVSGNANGLCEDGEWGISHVGGAGVYVIPSLTVDTINGTIYAGLGYSAGVGDIFSCRPQVSGNANGICENGEWIKAFETGAAIESIQSLTFDPINGTIYAGLGLSAGDGDIYSCRPKVSGNANGLCEDGEWIKAFETGVAIEAINSLTVDPISGTIYAGLGNSGGDGDIFSCQPLVSGNANGLCEDGEWTKAFETGAAIEYTQSLIVDPINGTIYAGLGSTAGDGDVFYHFIGDSQISNNGLVDISGTNGTITFATSSPYYNYIGDTNYLLQMTVSNIVNTDYITIDFNNASSTGNITSGQITLSGDSSTVTHYIDASISSAANQTFAVGQATTSIAAITITENSGNTIKATNDIRITIATSSVNMRWDITDTTAIITGTASSSVSTTVSYENNGATLVINVTSDFGASENITISGLSFLNFNSFNLAYTGALRLYLDGVSSTVVNAYDDKSIAIAGSLVLADHQLGQVSSQWRTGSSTVSSFYYRYKLTGVGETINTGTTTFDLSGISGVTTGDISNASLYYDFNGDGKITASTSWIKSFETGGLIESILSFTVDPLNGTIYAGLGLSAGDGDIFSCQPKVSGNANGLCEDGEWTKSFETGAAIERIQSLTFDPVNGTIYAGLGSTAGDGDIYSCQPLVSGNANGLCEDGEWSLSFETGALIETVNSLTVDPINGTIYAGLGWSAGDGDIYSCQPKVSGNANGLCEDGEWIKAFETGALIETVNSLTFDPVNGTIYAGLGWSAGDGDIYSCQPKVSGNANGLCEDGEWIKAFETETLIETVNSLTVDPINGTIYAGLGDSTGDGDIYACQPLVSGNANGLCEDGEWSLSFETGALIESTQPLTVDPINGTIYAGLGFTAGDGDIYSCQPLVSGNANGLCEDGEWIIAFETGAAIEYTQSLIVDPINGTIYAGLGSTAGDGDIFYHFIGDSQIRNNGLVDISGTNGTITFATSSPYYNSIGDTNYLLQMTVSNIVNTDYITIDFNNADSTGNITSGQIILSGDSSAVTHQKDAAISSATNQTFSLGQATTSMAAITITENSGNTIKATNDIRITIATSSVNMRWDTTDTTAIITGTASSSVSTTVSYENNGATLVINVTSDFGASENITISGLSFLNFNSFNLAYTGALRLYLDGVLDTVVNAYDDKSITIAAALILSNHQLGQVSNQWQVGSSTVSNFHYRYKLTGVGEAINTGTTTFDLSGISGVTTGDISNAGLYYDFNGDGKITASTSWIKSFETGGLIDSIQSLTVDSINETIYAGLGNTAGDGDIYACQPKVSGNANGLCEDGEWSLSFESGGGIEGVFSLTFDPLNGTIYAGLGSTAGDGDIFSCQPLLSGNANGLCEDGEWSKSFDGGASVESIFSLTFDPINATIYAGLGDSPGDGDIYSCQPLVSGNANGLCENGEWSISFDGGALVESIFSLITDPINGAIYAGLGISAGDGDIYSCQPLVSGNANGLCEDGEWIKSFETGATIEYIPALAVDPINGTIYAGLGLTAGDGDIYSCRPKVSGNANGLCEDGEWSLSFDGGAEIERIYSLAVDPINGTIYAGLGLTAGDGDVYSCRPKVSGNANGLCEDGEWIKAFETGTLIEAVYSLTADSLSGVIYAGLGSSAGDGDVFYLFTGDSQISSNGLVNISGDNGTITFATSSTYYNSMGANNYLLKMTVDNIYSGVTGGYKTMIFEGEFNFEGEFTIEAPLSIGIQADQMPVTVGSINSVGNMTGRNIILVGDASSVFHTPE